MWKRTHAWYFKVVRDRGGSWKSVRIEVQCVVERALEAARIEVLSRKGERTPRRCRCAGNGWARWTMFIVGDGAPGRPVRHRRIRRCNGAGCVAGGPADLRNDKIVNSDDSGDRTLAEHQCASASSVARRIRRSRRLVMRHAEARQSSLWPGAGAASTCYVDLPDDKSDHLGCVCGERQRAPRRPQTAAAL